MQQILGAESGGGVGRGRERDHLVSLTLHL